jgi:hypothetical protein
MKTIKQHLEHPSSGLSHAGMEPAHDSARTTTWWLLGGGFSLAVGVWLVLSHRAFGLSTSWAVTRNDMMVGALSILVTLASMFRRTRPIRLGNAILGFWLLVTTWFMSGGSLMSRWNSTAMAIALILLSVPLGVPRRTERYPRSRL